jgi:hypothetical protein
MPVPPRQRTPALLQVGAVLSRLTGRDALQEVCRYLHEEFSGYSEVLVLAVAPDGAVIAREGLESAFPAASGTALPIAGRSELQVPVSRAGVPVAWLRVVATAAPPLDASDRSFLDEVARRIADAVPVGGPPSSATAPP